ncbi:MAG TPA: hypothetical protein VGS21_04540, partial [Acidimicrobiales bacterium]|nr:hypothetical protein [Acidimicrobiales bacterium]
MAVAMAVTALAGAATSCGIPVSGSPTVLAANAIPDCLLCIRPPFKPHPEKGKPPAGYYLVFMVA